MDKEQAISNLVAESLAKSLAENELNRAHLVARYTLAITELQAFKAVLEYDPALKELFEEAQNKMKEVN